MPKSYLPIKLLGEGQACITGPPDDHLGRQPGAPADEVDHQHQDQHLQEQIVQCSDVNAHLYNPPPPLVYSCGCRTSLATLVPTVLAAYIS